MRCAAVCDRRRVIVHWEGCLNARDLGGLPARGGALVRSGAVVRSDSLHRLTPAGVDAAVRHPVSRVVDLRSWGEVEAQAHPFANTPLYAHHPAWGMLRGLGDRPSLWEIYQAGIEQSAPALAAAATAVAEAPPGAVVVHCNAGKDRTGILVALLLSAVGVPHDVIVADYVRSDEFLAAHYRRELSELDGDEAAWLASIQRCDPDVMRWLLRHLDEVYGGAQTYLVSGGMSLEAIDLLIVRLLGEGVGQGGAAEGERPQDVAS